MEYVKQQITSFLSTNLTQDYPDYNPATTYTFESGALTSASVVRYGTYYWRSLVTGNVGFNPETYENTKWVKWQVANTFAMLDLSALSKSIKASGDIEVVFALEKSTDTIGVGYYEADTVLVEVLDATDTVLWSYETPSTLYDGIVDWWTWIYPPFDYQLDRSVMIKIPAALGTKCRVTLSLYVGESQTACGFLTAGESVDMGETLSKVSFGFNSYAIKEFDDFGSLRITKRSVQDIVDFETIIEKTNFMRRKRQIKGIYNDIVMFVLDPSEASEYENLITLGVIEQAQPIMDEFDKSIISWSILEAI